MTGTGGQAPWEGFALARKDKTNFGYPKIGFVYNVLSVFASESEAIHATRII